MILENRPSSNGLHGASLTLFASRDRQNRRFSGHRRKWARKGPGRHRHLLAVLAIAVAAPVKGPTHVVKRGKTPVLSVEDARTLLDSIPLDSLQGLRDRALIGVMLFSFARVSAVLLRLRCRIFTKTDAGAGFDS